MFKEYTPVIYLLAIYTQITKLHFRREFNGLSNNISITIAKCLTKSLMIKSVFLFFCKHIINLIFLDNRDAYHLMTEKRTSQGSTLPIGMSVAFSGTDIMMSITETRLEVKRIFRGPVRSFILSGFSKFLLYFLTIIDKLNNFKGIPKMVFFSTSNNIVRNKSRNGC